jgi:hypothetical protein
VITVRLSLGISTSMFFKLWVLAPFTFIVFKKLTD